MHLLLIFEEETEEGNKLTNWFEISGKFSVRQTVQKNCRFQDFSASASFAGFSLDIILLPHMFSVKVLEDFENRSDSLHF